MNIRKWFLMATSLIILVASLYAIRIRLSTHDYYHMADPVELDEYVVRAVPPISDKKSQTITLDTLIEEAEIIAVVRFDGVRKIQYECMLSQVSVLEIFKGELKNFSIWIYEPGYFHYISQSSKYVVEIRDCCLPMVSSRKYLLFLKCADIPRPYKMEQGQFLLINHTYGKIDYENDHPLDIKTTDSFNTKYKEIKDLMIVSDEQAIIDCYIENHIKAVTKFNLR